MNQAANHRVELTARSAAALSGKDFGAVSSRKTLAPKNKMTVQLTSIRPLEQQFEKCTVRKIRSLQQRISRFPLKEGGAQYYLNELGNTLEAGLLLASLHLTLSFLELFARALLIYQKARISKEDHKRKNIEKIEIEIEDSSNPQWSFSKIVNKLRDEKIITNKQLRICLDHYKKTRIPLHHGITRRFIRGQKKQAHDDFDEISEFLFCSRSARNHSIENKIELEGINIIDDVFGLMEEICETNKIYIKSNC